MTTWNSKHPSQTQAIDWLFTRLAGGNAEPAQAPFSEGASGEASPGPSDAAASEQVPPPPAIESPADLQIAYEWLVKERKRLETYTRSQLARLQHDHQAQVAENHFTEQALILRSQELSRQEELLGQRGRSLQQQAADLVQREKALAAQLEQWWKAQEELAAIKEAHASVRQDTESQCAVREALRAETTALQKSREAAQADLDTLFAALQEQREARAKEQALAAAHRAQMEQRLLALEKAETAVQRRVTELDELEDQLRQEFQAQERQVASERQEIQALLARLRHQRPGNLNSGSARMACPPRHPAISTGHQPEA